MPDHFRGLGWAVKAGTALRDTRKVLVGRTAPRVLERILFGVREETVVDWVPVERRRLGPARPGRYLLDSPLAEGLHSRGRVGRSRSGTGLELEDRRYPRECSVK